MSRAGGEVVDGAAGSEAVRADSVRRVASDRWPATSGERSNQKERRAGCERIV